MVHPQILGAAAAKSPREHFAWGAVDAAFPCPAGKQTKALSSQRTPKMKPAIDPLWRTGGRFGNLSAKLLGLATANRPAVPPRGERAVIVIIAIAVELTDHLLFDNRVRGRLHAVKRVDHRRSVETAFTLCFYWSVPILKKRDHQTESRLLLESEEPLQLPPAEIEDSAILVQFDKFKPFMPELLQQLRAGTTAEPVPVMNDGSTFAVHGETRTFWVKLWHTAGTERTKIERAQVISCLPSTRGTTVVIDDEPGD